MAEREDPATLETMIFGPVGMIALGLGHTAMAVLLQDVLDPLNRIFTTLEADHPKAFEAVKGKRDEIVNWVGDFADLIGEVCASGGLEEIFVGHTFEPLDVNIVLNEALLAVGECLSLEHINIARRYASPLPDVLGNRDLLRLAFRHLIINAVEAINASSRKGGTVTLETGLFYDDSVKVEISDNGCGIPEGIKPRALFQMGCTTKEGHPGLGLPIAILVAHAHDGTFCLGDIDVPEAASEGTTFTMILPDV